MNESRVSSLFGENTFVKMQLSGAKAMHKEQNSFHQTQNATGRTKRFVMAFLVLAVIFLSAALPTPRVLEDKFIVVLDAGHGGKDPGNLGTGRYKKTEKDISLDVAQRVGKYINDNFPDIEVVYTRKGDTYPTLNERVQIANKANADLFISIHCNANDNKSALGVETFVMGLHKSEESLNTAMKENASIFLEEDHESVYGGFDPKSPDTYIALSLRENVFMDQSLTLAKSVQEQFRTRVGRKDRGVKQAGFWVISYTNMPSILVELGFLTNESEEDFLHSDDGKTYLSSSIYRAFKEFFEKSKQKISSKNAPSAPGTIPMDKKTEASSEKSEPVATKNDSPIETPIKKEETPKKVEPAPVKNEPKPEPKVVAEPSSKPTAEDIFWKDVPSGIRYHIQILSSPKPLNKKGPEFKGLNHITEYKQNGTYKYLAGCTNIFKEAKELQSKLRDLGYKDAFVVAFDGDQRIELSKAIALTK
jgi:N-acetylmuramoyl-L-alanine amidase